MISILSFPKKPIAISIINSLPSINLHIHNPDDDENRMHMLVDTEATINTRHLQYHLWVISQCPEMADEYLKCGKNIVYAVIHLLAALDLKNTDRDVDHGKMTAVINYRTPYIVQVRDSFILSFDLGHDVSLRCVPVLPTLLFIELTISLLSWKLLCTEFNRKFPLTLDSFGKGLPDGTILNKYSPSIPPGFSINITSFASLL